MQNDVASHAAKPHPEEYPPTKVTVGFDALAFPVLVRRLGEDSTEVLCAALRAALRMLPTALNTAKAVEAGIVPELVRLATHSDVTVRRTATEALAVAVRFSGAKHALVEGGFLVPFKEVFDDTDATVRGNATAVMHNLVHVAPFPIALASAGYVLRLVKSAQSETTAPAKAAVLRVLAKVVEPGSPGQAEAVSDATATTCVVRLLDYPSYEVKEEAARVLSLLVFSTEGKTLAVEGGAVPLLCKLMAESSSTRVRAEAAAACMGIAVDDAGKAQFLEAGVESVVDMLDDADPIGRHNAMRAVSALSASPAVRAKLMESSAVSTIKRRLERATGREKDILEKTLAAVTWEP